MIVPQHAPATANSTGDATFVFPDVPQGAAWCGTMSVPEAPAEFVGIVTAGGQLIGSMYGPGVFGPWVANYSEKVIITATGLVEDVQYQAVWHVDTALVPRLSWADPINAEQSPLRFALETPILCPAGDTTNVLPTQGGPYYIDSWGVTNIVDTTPPPLPGLFAQAGFGGSDVLFSVFDALNVTAFEQWSDRPDGLRVPGMWVTNNTGVDYDVGVVAALVNVG